MLSEAAKVSRNGTVVQQARAKAHKEQRRARIDARHKHIFSILSETLDLDQLAVEEYVLDGNQVRNIKSYKRRPLYIYMHAYFVDGSFRFIL